MSSNEPASIGLGVSGSKHRFASMNCSLKLLIRRRPNCRSIPIIRTTISLLSFIDDLQSSKTSSRFGLSLRPASMADSKRDFHREANEAGPRTKPSYRSILLTRSPTNRSGERPRTCCGTVSLHCCGESRRTRTWPTTWRPTTWLLRTELFVFVIDPRFRAFSLPGMIMSSLPAP